jgi:hypothetical protein
MCEPSHGQRVLAKAPQGCAQQALYIVSTEHGVNTILVDHNIEGQILILWGALAVEDWLAHFKSGG